MHFLKALFYDIILVAQIFTVLTVFNITNLSHDAKNKSNLKSNDSFINEVKDSKIPVKDEIDEQLKKQQI